MSDQSRTPERPVLERSREGHFDVPHGWLPRRTALVQMLALPACVGTAFVLIGMIAMLTSCS